MHGAGSTVPMAERAPLAGRTVLTTREREGALDRLLRERGAHVVHVPLVETLDPTDDAALATAIADIDRFDWAVVTSPNGAERLGPALSGARCRVAAVGSRTASVVAQLSGRRVDVVPVRQTAADLVAAMPTPTTAEHLLLAQADRAAATAAAGLSDLGYSVEVVTAYRTVLRAPTASERMAMGRVDAVAFASGSSVEAWVDAVGRDTPPIVAVIGPSTARVAADLGVDVSIVASDHSIEGLADAVEHAMVSGP